MLANSVNPLELVHLQSGSWKIFRYLFCACLEHKHMLSVRERWREGEVGGGGGGGGWKGIPSKNANTLVMCGLCISDSPASIQ